MDDLWEIPLTVSVPSPSNIQSFQSKNSIIHTNQSEKELSHYLHVCYFSPTSTKISNAILKMKFLDSPASIQLQFYDICRIP